MFCRKIVVKCKMMIKHKIQVSFRRQMTVFDAFITACENTLVHKRVLFQFFFCSSLSLYFSIRFLYLLIKEILDYILSPISNFFFQLFYRSILLSIIILCLNFVYMPFMVICLFVCHSFYFVYVYLYTRSFVC